MRVPVSVSVLPVPSMPMPVPVSTVVPAIVVMRMSSLAVSMAVRMSMSMLPWPGSGRGCLASTARRAVAVRAALGRPPQMRRDIDFALGFGFRVGHLGGLRGLETVSWMTCFSCLGAAFFLPEGTDPRTVGSNTRERI